jgi:N-acetylmuramoyl-L-alanine amidase
MSAAAIRSGVLFAVACLVGACSFAADAPVRAAPARPGAQSAGPKPATAQAQSRRQVPVDRVSVAQVASRLGLKLTERDEGLTAIITGPGVRAEIEGGSRELKVNGLRVFLGYPAIVFKGDLYVSRIDFDRCLAPLLRPGYGVWIPPRPTVIALDPGHGGRDQGTSSLEKVYALDVAKRAKKDLEAAGYQVVLTRSEDVYLELAERAEIANNRGADVFISIHFNALPNDRKTSGVEVFTFAPKNQRSTASWSIGSSDDTEDDGSPVNQYDHWSSALAAAVQNRFVDDLKTFDRGKKIAHWGVLRTLRCPSILIEFGFLTSDVESRKIATPAYREEIAEALCDGVRDFAATLEVARKRVKR